MDNVPSDLSGVFDDEGMDRAVEWSMLCQAIIRMEPERNADRLKQATDNLAVKCNERWMEIEEKGVVEFNTLDLGVPLDGLTEEVQVGIVQKTSYLLMAGVGGPHETAVILCEGIDMLDEEIKANL